MPRLAPLSRPSRLALALSASGRATAGGRLCWRLVRSAPAGRIAGRGGVVAKLGRGGLLEALARLKVVEEALELAAGGTPWEAGDVLEALRYWAEVSGWGWGAVEEAARAKRAAAGGFEGHAALGPCRAAAMSLGVPGYAISPRRALLRRVVRAG